jgi:hypothetical protein
MFGEQENFENSPKRKEPKPFREKKTKRQRSFQTSHPASGFESGWIFVFFSVASGN